MELQQVYHAVKVNNVLNNLKTSLKGLSAKETQQRLLQYGLNRLKEEKGINPLFLFLRQFRSFIVYILLAATLISFFLGEVIDAVVIFLILIANAILGFIQEYRAEKAMKALQKMTSLKAKVLRDNAVQEIDAEDIVPGDIVFLEEGDKVPADGRLFEIVKLKIQESALTGESIPVSKIIDPVVADAVLGDRKNMMYAGTIVTYGRGKAVVVATGMQTELGKIATALAEEKVEQTPLQKKLNVLGKNIGIATLLICALIFIIGFYRGTMDLFSLLLAAIALAVAAVPEGLPAVVTISLALGVQRMVKRHALVRQLARVETLGCTSIICTDKTGTLTCNEMTVRRLYIPYKEVEVSGVGYNAQGSFLEHGKNSHIVDFEKLLTIGILCNNASLGQGKCVGDPTEASLLVVAAKAHLSADVLNKQYSRVDEIPFDSTRKMMSTVHHAKNKYLVCTKGAPEMVLQHCTHILINSHVKPLTAALRKEIIAKNIDFASHALRVLGFAYKELPHLKKEVEEKNLIFVGLQGMIDPPRLGVKEAVVSCHNAGIRVVMVTGDYEITAKSIGKELGIGDRVMTGKELDQMNNEGRDLAKVVEKIDIFARVNPEHKLLIVKALRKLGHIVAMTGDGVNDAPALKSADIGIAMGISGTAVAKEASAMVLTDDHFVSIVDAVKEGRAIYDNIKKFVNYLLSSNLGEVLLLFFAMLMGFTDSRGNFVLPLLALHILWLNLVTDGLPALALGIDPADPHIMERKPRHAKERLITLNMGLSILCTAVLITIATLILFAANLASGVVLAQTVVFTALVVMEIVRVYTIRMQYNISLFSNKYLFGAILISFFLQFLVVYGPLQKIFNTTALDFAHWMMILTATAIVFALDMLAKKIITWFTREMD